MALSIPPVLRHCVVAFGPLEGDAGLRGRHGRVCDLVGVMVGVPAGAVGDRVAKRFGTFAKYACPSPRALTGAGESAVVAVWRAV